VGIIVRQGIKFSLVSFLGVAIGMISVLFIYPMAIKEVGFINTFISIGSIMAPLVAFGLGSVSIRFFPIIENGKRSGFIPFIFLLFIINFLFFLFVFYLLKEHFYAFLLVQNFDISAIRSNEFQLIIYAVLISFGGILTSLISNFGRIVVPNMINNLGFKFVLPAYILAIVYGFLSFDNLSLYVIYYNGIAVLLLMVYLYFLNNSHFDIKKSIKQFSTIKPLYTYGFFSVLTAIGGMLSYRIDTIMLAGLMDYETVGKYVLAMTMAAVMDVPNIAINNIAGPIVSKAWQSQNMDEIKTIYKSASINLTSVAGLILIGGYFCFSDLGRISSNPDAFIGLEYVFLILGISKLTDMATSVNNMIIAYSPHYKVNLYILIILAILNISLNFYLIPIMGIIGACIATAISISIFNISKLIFIQQKYQLHPFSFSLLKVLLLITGLFVLFSFIPLNFHPIVNIGIKTVAITVIYGYFLFTWNVSKEIVTLKEKLLSLIGK
jgi:O-antigen/teichoic acid export membrane protein